MQQAGHLNGQALQKTLSKTQLFKKTFQKALQKMED